MFLSLGDETDYFDYSGQRWAGRTALGRGVEPACLRLGGIGFPATFTGRAMLPSPGTGKQTHPEKQSGP